MYKKNLFTLFLWSCIFCSSIAGGIVPLPNTNSIKLRSSFGLLPTQTNKQPKKFFSTISSFSLQSFKKHPYLFCGLFSCIAVGTVLYFLQPSLKKLLNSCNGQIKNVTPKGEEAEKKNFEKQQDPSMNVQNIISTLVVGTSLLPIPINSNPTDNIVFEEVSEALSQIVNPKPTTLPLKPSEVIKILQDINAIESSDDTLHSYTIRSATQGWNQCWIYAGRNHIFMNHLFLAKNKEEIESLYKTMINQRYATTFAEGLIKKPDVMGFGYSPTTGEGANVTFTRLQQYYPEAFDGTLLPQTSQSTSPSTENFKYMGFSKIEDPNSFLSGGYETLKNFINEIEKTNVAAKSHLVHDVMLSYTSKDLLGNFEKLVNDDTFTIITMNFSKKRPHCHGIALVITKEKDTQNNNLYHYLFADSLHGSFSKKQINRFNELLTNSTYRQETKLRSIVLLGGSNPSDFKNALALDPMLQQINECDLEKLTAHNLINSINTVCRQIEFIVAHLNRYYTSLTTNNNISKFNGLALYKEKYKPYLNKNFAEQKTRLLNILKDSLKPALKKIEIFIKNAPARELSKEEIEKQLKDAEERLKASLNDLKKREERYQKELEEWQKEEPGPDQSLNYLRRIWENKKPYEPSVPPKIANFKKRIELIKEDPKKALLPKQADLDLLKKPIADLEKDIQKVTELVDKLPTSIP